MSMHRYAFVNDNPVNNVDEYGFYVAKEYRNALGGFVTNLGNLSVGQQAIQTLSNGLNRFTSMLSNGQSYMINEKTRVDGKLPALSANVNRTFWASYGAEMKYYDHVCMNGVIGRLQARGYEMDYSKVYQYLSSQTTSAFKTFQIKQAQYQRAQASYNKMLNYSRSLDRGIAASRLILNGFSKLSHAFSLINSFYDQEINKTNVKINAMVKLITRVESPEYSLSLWTQNLNKTANKIAKGLNVSPIHNAFFGVGVDISFGLVNLAVDATYYGAKYGNKTAILPMIYKSDPGYFDLLYKNGFKDALSQMDVGLKTGFGLDPYRRSKDTGSTKYACFIAPHCNLYEDVTGKSNANSSQVSYDILSTALEIDAIYGIGKSLISGGKSISKIFTKGGNDVDIKITKNSLEHINQRHVPNYPSNVGKGTLFPKVPQSEITDKILTVTSKATPYGNKGNLVYESLVTFSNGETRTLRVVTTQNGELITSYPL